MLRQRQRRFPFTSACFCALLMAWGSSCTSAFLLPRTRSTSPRLLHLMRKLSTAVQPESQSTHSTGSSNNSATPAAVFSASGEQRPLLPPPSPDDKALLPGDLDELNGFRLGPSVAFWREWENSGGAAARVAELTQQATTSLLQGGVPGSKEALAARYWAAHLLRSGFFASQGLLSTFVTAAQSGFSDNHAGSRIFNQAMERGDRILYEALEVYEQDLQNIQRGLYKPPYDAMNITHRQYNPLFVLDRSSRFLREAVKTLERRTKEKPDPVWLSSDLYPSYYLNSWHYQTDGWLSTTSAKVYEASTETLFIGRQDAMQRHTMLPIASWLEEQGHSKSGSGLSLLEVACGTGRFLTFLRDNYPAMNLTGLDLSPFYLQEGRDNLRYYESFLRRMGKEKPSGQVSYLQSSADKVPLADESVDVLTCVYLFHELPKEELPKVVKEMGRLVRPGGLVVITDSIQLGDRAALNPVLGRFTDFNEPNYDTYIETDLGALFREHTDLEPYEKHLVSSTKILSFKKPGGPPQSSS